MIHILLMILKIIGMILLAVLGILLLLVLSLLFVPVRYKVQGSWHGQLAAAAKVSWLFHLLSFNAVYSKDGLSMVLRVFGIHLLKKKKKDVAEAAEEGAETVLGQEEQTLYDELEEDEARYRKAAQERKMDSGRTSGGFNSKDTAGDCGAPSGNSGSPQDETAVRSEEPQASEGKLRSFFRRISDKITGLWKKLRFSFTSFCDKLKGIRTFAGDKKKWLEDEKNQASLRLLWKQTRRLTAHIWPRKGRGTVTFGFDDPYTTGQVLQAASLIYPLYHRQLSVYPVFDEQIFDAEGSFKGRIRLAVLLWLAFQVFWDKHTRRMIRGFISR